jgi:hypothetical protein
LHRPLGSLKISSKGGLSMRLSVTTNHFFEELTPPAAFFSPMTIASNGVSPVFSGSCTTAGVKSVCPAVPVAAADLQNLGVFSER